MAQMGMDEFERAFSLAQQFTKNIIENKIFHVVEVVIQDLQSEDDPVEDAQSLDATDSNVPSHDVPS